MMEMKKIRKLIKKSKSELIELGCDNELIICIMSDVLFHMNENKDCIFYNYDRLIFDIFREYLKFWTKKEILNNTEIIENLRGTKIYKDYKNGKIDLFLNGDDYIYYNTYRYKYFSKERCNMFNIQTYYFFIWGDAEDNEAFMEYCTCA